MSSASSPDGEESYARPRRLKSPVLEIHRHRKSLRKSRIDLEKKKHQLLTFFFDVASGCQCIDMKHPDRKTGCRCLGDVRGWLEDSDVELVVDFLVDFSLMEKDNQRVLLQELIK